MMVNCSRKSEVKTIVMELAPVGVSGNIEEENEGSIKKVYTHDIISTLEGENVSLQYIGWITDDRILAYAAGESDSYYVLVDESFGFLRKISDFGENVDYLSLSDNGRYAMYGMEGSEGYEISVYDFNGDQSQVVYLCGRDEYMASWPGFSSDNSMAAFYLKQAGPGGAGEQSRYRVILYDLIAGKIREFTIHGMELTSCDTVIPQNDGKKLVFYTRTSETVSSAATLTLTSGDVVNDIIYNNRVQTVDMAQDETLEIIYGDNIVASKTKVHVSNFGTYFANKYGELRWLDSTFFSQNDTMMKGVASFKISESSDRIAYTINYGNNKKTLYIAKINNGTISEAEFLYSLQNADIISWNNRGNKLLMVEEVHNKKVYRILELNIP
ncbi:MAG: hypothetical protein ACYCX2_07875 [Christensenellales bacterium]